LKERSLRAWRQNQQILAGRFLSQDRLNQALHLATDAQIVDATDVKSYFHPSAG
jgi:hypothetical protein